MAWSIPDKGEGDSNIQSILFQEYLDALVAGLQGIDCVLNGLAMTGGADMTPDVAKGAVLSNGTMFAVAAASVTVTTADATNPRIDLVVVNSSGVLAVRAGTAAAAPKPPARSANDVIIAAIYVPANDTTIGTTAITDLRVMRDRNVTVYRKTSATTFATNNTIQTYATLTLPSGLLAAAGRVLRFRCGGSWLLNTSGLSTLTLTIAYGGTTFFADTSTTPTADADRGGWYLDFSLVHSGSATQFITGLYAAAAPLTAGRVAPTTGIAGMLEVTPTAFTNAPVATVIRGIAGTVDSDAADRTLTIQWTMSVSNANSEMTCDYAFAELI